MSNSASDDQMLTLGRRDLLLFLVGIGAEEGRSESLGGITRLQKLVFLLEKEERIVPTGDGFEFVPYDAGPYSSRLYDDLQFLENLGFLGSEITSESTEEECPEIDALNDEIMLPDFGALVGDDPKSPEMYEERRFYVTQKGRTRIDMLLATGEYHPFELAIQKVKGQYGKLSLTDLLYYVYTNYPEMTSESKIREKVLGRKKQNDSI